MMTARFRRARGEEGFTLIELLVVIIILGILSAVVVFAVQGTGDKGAEAAYATDAKTIRTAQEAYCAQKGRYASEPELVAEKFLSEPSSYHFTDAKPSTEATASGKCEAANDLARSKFVISCNPTEAGCGAGGALAQGGKLVLPGSDPKLGLNPAVNTQGGMQVSASGLFLGLIELDAAGNPIPGLATEVPTVGNGITADLKSYTFKVAKDKAKWQDFATSGQFVKASDVKFSFEAALLRFHARALSSVRPALAGVCTDAPTAPNCSGIVADDTTDPMTVTFNFTRTYAPLLAQLAQTDGAIIPKHIWPSCYTGGACPTPAVPWPTGQDPVGAGPYRYGNGTAGTGMLPDGYHFFKNPYYAEFKPGQPVFDEVWQKFGPDPYPSLNELRAGTIDFASLSGNDLVALAGSPDANIVQDRRTASAGGSTNCTLKLIYNLWYPGKATTGVPDPLPAGVTRGTPGATGTIQGGGATPHPIFGDPLVRKAFAEAIDRSLYINDIQRNDGSKLSTSPVNSVMAWASGNNPIPAYNLVQANADLDTAGWTGRDANNFRQKTVNGVLLTLKDLEFSGFKGPQVSVLTKMNQNLAVNVGMSLKVVTDSPPTMNLRYSDRNFDAIMFSNCQATDPEVGMSRVYKKASINGAPFTNGAGYMNATVDAAFADAAAQTTQAARAPFYAQIATQLQADLPTLWLIETVANKGYRNNCSGFKFWTGLYAEAASCRR